MTTTTANAVSALNKPLRSSEARWRVDEVEALYALPLMDLVYSAQQVHREHFDVNELQLSTLLSIKTGGCPEDCGYCPQSAHFDTGVGAGKLMPLGEVLQAARSAHAQGVSRFCMGAAWRSPKERDIERVSEMVRGVKALGPETCMTLGMLDAGQARALKDAGLDYYNHKLDTVPEFYGSRLTASFRRTPRLFRRSLRRRSRKSARLPAGRTCSSSPISIRPISATS